MDKLEAKGIGAVEFGNDGTLLGQLDFNFANYYGHVGGAYRFGPQGMESIYYKGGSDNTGILTIISGATLMNILFNELSGNLSGGMALVSELVDLSTSIVLEETEGKPDTAYAAQKYAEQTAQGWGLWYRVRNSLFFNTTAELNIAAFLKTHFTYYRKNTVSADDISEIKKILDIQFGNKNERDILV